jgi:hypothetical protein
MSLVVASGCSSGTDGGAMTGSHPTGTGAPALDGGAPAPDDTGSPADAGTAPRYTELFDRFFGPGTLGHCATSGCHADPGHNVWLCETRDECYRGMVDVGLVDAAHPTRSAIADAARSPLTWVNPAGGNMPLDAQQANAEARDAIRAWVAAGAHDD